MGDGSYAKAALDESVNTVIQNEDDGQSSLDTSLISVIKVSDGKDDEAEQTIEAAKVAVDENLTLSMAQFEMILSDLKTRHLAEKRMLQCDLALCKKTILLMAKIMRSHAKDKQRNEIRMLQIKKLQEVNKFMKQDNAKLTSENTVLTDQCSKLKTLMVNYEQEALYQRLESNVSAALAHLC